MCSSCILYILVYLQKNLILVCVSNLFKHKIVSTISLYINGMVVYKKIYTYSLYPKLCVLQKEL
jgi:hypothetical protein